jgi:hypothetical protein
MPRLPLAEAHFEAALRSTKDAFALQGEVSKRGFLETETFRGRQFASGCTRDEKIDLKQQTWREVGDVGFGDGGG